MTEDYDKLRDAVSEARYEDDPRAEPTSEETKEAVYRCLVDESAGVDDRWADFRG